jgi:eukaryotic-like serine/threonine-protein kinase
MRGAGGSSIASAAVRQQRPSTRALAIAAVVLIALSGAAGRMLRPPQAGPATPTTRFTLPVPDGHDMAGGFMPNLAVSRDGRAIAYFLEGTLFIRRLDRDEAQSLIRFDNGCCLAFTDDGRSILMSSHVAFGTSMWSISIADGTLTDLAARPIQQDLVAGGWRLPGIMRRRAGDMTWAQITTADTSGTAAIHMWPQLLDNGRSVLFTTVGAGGMWNDASVVVADIATGQQTVVVSGGTYGRYVATGHVIYIRADGSVEAVPYDLRKQRVTGNAFTVQTGVRTAYWGGAGEFAISDGGTFTFVKGSSWRQHRLTWVDRQGTVLQYVGEPVTVEGVRLSPDERYAVSYVASPQADIDRFDMETGEQRRLTFDPETEDHPAWLPDGRRIAYRRLDGTTGRILIRSVDGLGLPEVIPGITGVPHSWSPDGAALAFGLHGMLAVLHLASQRVDTVTTTGNGGAQFSPDGRWLVYASDETGQGEVYVRRYPITTDRLQISRNGGRLPLWSTRSGELFFLTADTLMAVSISTGHDLDWTTPRALFARPDLAALEYSFAVSADGRRFLFPTRNPNASAREINVVLSWFEELKAKAKQ